MGIRLVSAALGPQWLGLSERARHPWAVAGGSP